MTASYLYIIAHPEGWRKVGRAIDPVARLSQHQHHSGARLVGEKIFPCEDPKEMERRAHRALSDFRIMGEWFAIAGDDAVERIEAATGLIAESFPEVRYRSGAKTAAISLRVAPVLKEAIENLAADDRRKVAAYVELILVNHCAEKGILAPDTPKKTA